jgi:ABC-2 type transport system permease protein
MDDPKPAYKPPHPIVAMVTSGVLQFVREPAALFWVYGFPMILSVVLGLAFRNRPVVEIPIDIRSDGPGGVVAAERVQQSLAADTRLKVTLGNETTTHNRLRTAKTDLVIVPAAQSGSPDEFRFDANRPEATLARTAVERVLLRSALPSAPVPKETEVDEPGARYIDFLFPGLIGLNLMGGGLFGIGFMVVDQRVRKLLKRFLATPMSRRDYLLSIMLSRLMFTLIDVAVLTVFAYFAFDIRIRGDFLTFVVLVLIGGISFAGLGLLIACRAKTLETVSGLMNAVMLPMYLVSGVFFSSERFPEWMLPVIKALPLTALIDGLRKVMNDGDGFENVLRELAILTAWGVVSFVLALKLFRWR